MGNPLNAVNLGNYLGTRDREHIRKWTRAGIVARRELPKCEAVARGTGHRCRLLPLRGSRHCLHHSKGEELDAASNILAAEAIGYLENGGTIVQIHRAKRTLARIARRRLHQLWKVDPRVNGSTLELDDRTEAAVRDWLRERQIYLAKPLPNSSHAATPRCIDRLRWAAYRVIRRGRALTDEFRKQAELRVAAALADDQRFWKKLESAESYDFA